MSVISASSTRSIASFASADSLASAYSSSSTASASAFIADIMAYADRKASWTRGFAMIGREPQAREIYDGLMDAAATAGVPEAINDFTLAYWARCRAPTARSSWSGTTSRPDGAPGGGHGTGWPGAS